MDHDSTHNPNEILFATIPTYSIYVQVDELGRSGLNLPHVDRIFRIGCYSAKPYKEN